MPLSVVIFAAILWVLGGITLWRIGVAQSRRDLSARDSSLMPYWYGTHESSAPMMRADVLAYGLDYVIDSETRLSVLRASSDARAHTLGLE